MAEKFNLKNLNIIGSETTGKTEGFKRPNHNDFATTAELKEREFTGMRKNELARQWEFWIIGEIRATVAFEIAEVDPTALSRMHVEVFQMIPKGLEK